MPDAAPAAVVLLSGGLDSTTCLAIARREGFAVHALSFRYGQRHAHEVEAARRIAARHGVARHVVVDIDLRVFGGSALTADIDVPKDRPVAAMAGEGVPITYVPARNTIFLSYALALAETTGARDIFLGVNALDYSGYPDCRPAYVRAFERMANLATRAGIDPGHPDRIRIQTPLISLTKAAIIRRGVELGVDHSLTTSCYDPVPDDELGWLSCARCDSCRLRQRGFAEAGLTDPIRYVAVAH